MCVCARAIDKECHRICVCPRQRYRVAGLLECEMGHVQFVSCGMDTYLQRSTIGVWWGKREAQLTIEVQWLVYVWRRREAYLMY